MLKKTPYLFFLMLIAFAIINSNEVLSQTTQVYGYFSTRYEKSFSVPEASGNGVSYQDGLAEFSYPFAHIMMQSQLDDNFRVFINLNGSGGGDLSMRNFWGEYSAASYFNVRVGKMYRKFGLYNEILDAVPTYYGIEPPEMFDTDHLMISRTTAFMIHGNISVFDGNLNYAVTTDNGEGSEIFESVIPVGFDLNYKFNNSIGDFTIGTSYYNSGGATNSDVSIGEGSPQSGVKPWMAKDSFYVINGYIEIRSSALTIQFEYASTEHQALRDVDAVKDIVDNAGINAAQRARFLKDPNGPNDITNINTVGDYSANTWYTRIGYSFETSVGEIAPYFQFDSYTNPELISKKSFGGDNEAGNTDDGKFTKLTVGTVFRPIPLVALKLDMSNFSYKLNGQNVSYPEIRLDLSYTFGL